MNLPDILSQATQLTLSGLFLYWFSSKMQQWKLERRAAKAAKKEAKRQQKAN